jgi:hypothetical protein
MPVRATQASYNKPDNWRDRNRIGLEQVKEQLQSCIYNVLNSESFFMNLTHNGFGDHLMDNEEPIVWHEPVLNECWEKIEAEIDWRKQLLEEVTDIGDVHISNVEMKMLAALVAILSSGRANSSSTYIEFNNANLCGDEILCLSKLVEASPELRYFNLHHNRIDSMESARCLSRSLKSHTCVYYLDITHCNLGSSPEILLVVLQSDITHINLENNNIDSLGAVKIAEYLEGNPPIHRINLNHNRLNDDDAVLISQALKRNTILHEIDLVSNKITSIGVKILLTCVFDSSSLSAISESNHTLKQIDIFYVEFNDILVTLSDNLRGCIKRLLQLDRIDKILLALQDKDSIIKDLANVPVGLMPEVLALPHQQVDNEFQHRYLNILYSTMRWWNMPMLYSYYHDGCVKSDTKWKRDD